MDGVMLDSFKYNAISFEQVSGVKLSEQERKMFQYCALKDTVDYLNENYECNLIVETFSKDCFAIQMELMKDDLKPNKQFTKFLQDCKTKGIQLAIGTSSFKYRAEIITSLLGVRDYFTELVAADDVDRHKPDPAVYIKAAKRLNIDPGYCIVVEDAKDGIEAAINGGMKAVAIKTEQQDYEDLKEADLIFEKLEDLDLEKIKKLLEKIKD